MCHKHVFFGIVLGITLTGAAIIANRLDLFHDDARDYDEFEER